MPVSKPNRSDMDVVDQYAEEVFTHVMEHMPSLGHWINARAKKNSGTQFWTPKEWEQNEDTAQYDLYWSEYARHQSMVINGALKIALGRS